MTTQLWAIGLVLLACLLGSLGPLFLKKGAANFNLNIFKQLKNYYLLLGLFFYAVGTILFIPALKGGELSILYPLVSTGYVWVSFLSMKFLNEKMNSFKWVGIISILIGVCFIGLGS